VTGEVVKSDLTYTLHFTVLYSQFGWRKAEAVFSVVSWVAELAELDGMGGRWPLARWVWFTCVVPHGAPSGNLFGHRGFGGSLGDPSPGASSRTLKVLYHL